MKQPDGSGINCVFLDIGSSIAAVDERQWETLCEHVRGPEFDFRC